MKILHTADIHLKEYGDDRWKTLQKLIHIAEKKKVDVLAICGDLFDRGVDAEMLRPQIRELFSGHKFKILLISGNHDQDSYRGGLSFGENVQVINDIREPYINQNVRIWGIPFEPIGGEKIISKLHCLAGMLSSDKKNILLFHGELLDVFFDRRDFGEEGDERYMPVKLAYFKDLGLDYVLAGHFHSCFDIRKIDSRGYFVYPGSPVSITKRETGRRKANLFKVGEPPQEYPLDTPYYEDVVVEFDPLKDQKPLELIKERVAGLPPEAKLLLTVKGFFNGEIVGITEEILIKKINKLVEKKSADSSVYLFRDIRIILEDDLLKNFKKKLDKMSLDDAQEKKMFDIALQAMMGAAS